MNKAITNYEELLAEQQRLRAILDTQKEQIKKDVHELREELRPVIKVASVIGKFAIPDVSNNGAVKMGTNLTVDWILKKLIGRANPLLGLILPALIKNYTSHYTDKAVPFLLNIKDKLLARRTKANRE